MTFNFFASNWSWAYIFKTYINFWHNSAFYSFKLNSYKTSLTEYRHKMRSGDLPAYLSLNGPSKGSFMLLMLFCWTLALTSTRWISIMFLVLVSFPLKYQKFNSCVTDGQTDGRTYHSIEMRRDVRPHLKTESFIANAHDLRNKYTSTCRIIFERFPMTRFKTSWTEFGQ